MSVEAHEIIPMPQPDIPGREESIPEAARGLSIGISLAIAQPASRARTARTRVNLRMNEFLLLIT